MFDDMKSLRFSMDENAIGRLVLANGEKRNPLGATFGAELRRVMTWCDEAQTIRCLLITAEGPFFSGGGDLEFFATSTNLPVDMATATNDFHAGISKLLRMRAPVIIGVQGPAIGAGVSLVGMGDIVIAADNAFFQFGYTGIGFSPEGGSSFTLPRLIGLRRYKELALTNKRIDAGEAAAMGLITRVVAPERLHDEIEDVAMSVARGPTEAFGGVRRLLLNTFSNTLETQLELELRELSDRCRTADVREGLDSVRARRRPSFTGR